MECKVCQALCLECGLGPGVIEIRRSVVAPVEYRCVRCSELRATFPASECLDAIAFKPSMSGSKCLETDIVVGPACGEVSQRVLADRVIACAGCGVGK